MWVNTHMQLTHDAPFTGMKWSGLGSEMGLWSIYAYTDPQTVFRTRSQVIKKGAGEAPTPGSGRGYPPPPARTARIADLGDAGRSRCGGGAHGAAAACLVWPTLARRARCVRLPRGCGDRGTGAGPGETWQATCVP